MEMHRPRLVSSQGEYQLIMERDSVRRIGRVVGSIPTVSPLFSLSFGPLLGLLNFRFSLFWRIVVARNRKLAISPAERRRRVYLERNRNLAAMGFASYKQYLSSALWLGIRSAVLRDNPKCFLCKGKATQVHHQAYRKKDLDGRDLRRMFAICSPCHRRIEFRDSDGEKLNTTQATVKMKGLATIQAKRQGLEG
jgi:hypothetical protein